MSQHRYRFFFVISQLFLSSLVTLIRPIWFLRVTVGIVLSSIGILWHETLSTYDYLRKGSIYIMNLLDEYGFHIPIPKMNAIENHSNSSNLYTILGILLLGTLGIAFSIILFLRRILYSRYSQTQYP